MALFTDGPVSAIEDLTAHDTQLASVANIEQIDMTQKLRLAQDELALELSSMLDSASGGEQLLWRNGAAGLDGVVVTPALKLWHTYRALEMVYRDAFSNQLNDRYRAKRDQFAEQARWALEKLKQAGIGMTSKPLPQADVPTVTSTPGNLPNGTYYVRSAWVGTEGEEGASSVGTVFDCEACTFVVQTNRPPANATGSNVYVGTTPDSTLRQNGSPIPVGQNWLQPNSLKGDGNGPSCGQAAEYFKAVPRLLWRG